MDDVIPLHAVSAEDATVGPLIRRDSDTCRDCLGCVRVCPARAIRVVEGRSEVIAEKCVACGLCVSECGNSSDLVRDDTGRVRELLASGRPVVAILATEFTAALHPMGASEVEAALEEAGFYAVETTLLGEEMVAAEYERLHARHSGIPLLRSTCPVVVEWVKRYRPGFTSALAPLIPPYVAQAKLVKALYPQDTRVVYVGPCFARKDEIRDTQFEGAVDVALDFLELKRLISESAPLRPRWVKRTRGSHRPQPLKEISITDGFPRGSLESRRMTASDIAVARGLSSIDRLLVAMRNGECAPDLVDLLNCEGCLDGPAVAPGMSLFAKRSIESSQRTLTTHAAVSSRVLLQYLPGVPLVRSFVAKPVVVPVPDDARLQAILDEAGFSSEEERIDCGSCGHPTCVDHAIAIHQGNSSWEVCFPLQRKRLERSLAELEESATLDALTGLWNRRVFSERLTEEVARAHRYGTPLSMLMIDLDLFKEVNDTRGHVSGDCVLAGCGSRIRKAVRSTDIAARYGGDEFAVILPNTSKTEAFAVGEKLREALADAQGVLEEDGYTVAGRVRVTASVGVASVSSPGQDPIELLEAADRALYQAKQVGGDEVRLAPG